MLLAAAHFSVPRVEIYPANPLHHKLNNRVKFGSWGRCTERAGWLASAEVTQVLDFASQTSGLLGEILRFIQVREVGLVSLASDGYSPPGNRDGVGSEGSAMNRLFTGLVILAAASWATSPSAIAQPPAAAQSAAQVRRSASAADCRFDARRPPRSISRSDRLHHVQQYAAGGSRLCRVSARSRSDERQRLCHHRSGEQSVPEGSIRNAQYGTDNAFRIGGGYRPAAAPGILCLRIFICTTGKIAMPLRPPADCSTRP